MVDYYKTVDEDRIDLIVNKHYGSCEMLPTVLANNIHLSKLPLILTADIEIALPSTSDKIETKSTKEDYKEWLEV